MSETTEYMERLLHHELEENMAEQPTLKRLTGEITYRKDESDSRARIGFKPDGASEPEFYNLWRLNLQTKQPNPSDSKCVKGARGTLVLRFKRGGSKVKGDPSQGFWPDEWVVFDIDPTDQATSKDAEDVFYDAPAEATMITAPSRAPVATALTDRDKSIISQVAWKCAAQLGAMHYSAVGEKDFDINVVGKWAREIAADINSMAKDPFLWD